MKKMIDFAREKANKVAIKAMCAVSNTRGESTVSTAIVILTSVVLGALLLGGLYVLLEEVVLPSVTKAVQDMFNYKG